MSKLEILCDQKREKKVRNVESHVHVSPMTQNPNDVIRDPGQKVQKPTITDAKDTRVSQHYNSWGSYCSGVTL